MQLHSDIVILSSQRFPQIHQKVFKIKIRNTVWKNLFKYKYKIRYGKMYLNTNTVFCILKIHKINLKLAIQWSNTIKACLHKNNNYKDNYISVF